MTANLSPRGNLSPNEDLSPRGNLSPNGDLSPRGNLSPNGDLSRRGNLSPNEDLSPRGNPSPNGDLSPRGNLSPNGDLSPVFGFLEGPFRPVPWVKVCGVTRIEDARLSLELGADALGLNLWPRSRRYLSPERASGLMAGLREEAVLIGVVVLDETLDLPTLRRLPLTAFQVHGAAAESDLPDLGKPLLVGVPPERAVDFPDHPVIVDGSWGSGRRADWDALRRVSRPFVLSGGLDPDNVGEAVEILHPKGIDVCSGVESSPGIKDPARLRAFFQRLHGRVRPSDPGDPRQSELSRYLPDPPEV